MKRYLLFGLVVLLVGFLCLRAYKVRPGNAALLYQQAIGELPSVEEWNEFVLGSVRIGGKPAPGTIAILERYERPVKLVEQAVRLPVCNWGVDLKNGPHQDFKFVTEAVKLARLALERARLRFAEGDIAEGLRDWEAGMVLARRIRGEPLVLFSLAGAKAEEIGVQKVSPFLNRFSPAELARLDEIIRSLPPTQDLDTIIDTEYLLGYGWYESMLSTDRAELLRMLMERSLTREEFEKRIAVLRQELAELKPVFARRYPEMLSQLHYPELSQVTREFLPPLIRALGNVAKVDCEVAMLRAAAAVQAGRQDALTTIFDPLTGEPFEITRWNGGFRLYSQAKIDDKPIDWIFGNPIESEPANSTNL